MNKRAVELSINFLVVTILSLVILSLGIVLIRNFFTGAEDLTATIDQSVEAELRAAVASGKPVYVYPKTATIRSSEDRVFGVSVLNVGSTSLEQCRPIVKATKIYDLDNNDVTTSNPTLVTKATGWILDPETPENIAQRESTSFPILIQPGGDAVEDRIYVYDFDISCFNQAQYGKTQKVYLTIK